MTTKPAEGSDASSPRAIYTRVDWDEAVDDGALTAQHVLERLTRVAVYEFGQSGPAGYDADGFFVSLTAEGLRLENGVTLVVHTNDHQPPHIHVERKGHKSKLRLHLVTGEPLDELPSDISAKKLRRLQAALRESHEVLSNWWEKAHGPGC